MHYSGRTFGGPEVDPFSIRFDFAPVPEPATLTLLGLGGGALAVRRLWRRRA
jgi:hypothetical protein